MSKIPDPNAVRKRRERGTLRQHPGVSLCRVLSKLGIASRSEADALIVAGRVRVGRRVVRDPSHRVQMDREVIFVDGQRAAKASPEFWMLHKPAGFVTTRRDERGRRTVYDLLPPHLPYLFPIGRLDFDSSGLLLFTNDTQTAKYITDPTSHVPKVYEAKLEQPLNAEQAELLAAGVVVLGQRTQPAKVELVDGARPRHVRVTLIEGRNRQVRRMFRAVGHRVLQLHRVAIGEIQLGKLHRGEARRLRREELRFLARGR